MKMLLALPVVLSAGAAMAGGGSYTGNWALTVTHSQHGNGTYCLGLNDDGSFGWTHSGEATLTGQNVGGTLPYGSFQLIGHTLLVTIDQPGCNGLDASLVFVAPSTDGNIAKGIYTQVYAEAIDAGKVAFGTKGSC